jgi:hypothetical protein
MSRQVLGPDKMYIHLLTSLKGSVSGTVVANIDKSITDSAKPLFLGKGIDLVDRDFSHRTARKGFDNVDWILGVAVEDNQAEKLIPHLHALGKPGVMLLRTTQPDFEKFTSSMAILGKVKLSVHWYFQRISYY